MPFHFDNNLVPYYTGSFWALLNPFALLTGVVSTAMITFHGAIYLVAALFWAMSAGFVAGVGFTPHFLAWRLLLSGWACLIGIVLTAARLLGT